MKFEYSFNCALLMVISVALQQVTLSQFIMHYTEEVTGEMQHDCLVYTVLDDIATYGFRTLLQNQFIFYCIRPMKQINIIHTGKTVLEADVHGSISSVLSFEQLRIRNVSTSDLFIWSAPIDTIENYAAYLMNNADTNNNSQYLFYNCTSQWFGPTCQYTFDTTNSFSAVVKSNFEKRTRSIDEIQNSYTTCYIHLPCKYRSWGILCLDWSEVCDGKVDCIDGGADEQNCFDLEKNECKEDEYRCQNGLCISQNFYNDDLLNPECLDRSDEIYVFKYPDLCLEDPSIRCEEHTCRIMAREFEELDCTDQGCLVIVNDCFDERVNGFHRIGMNFTTQDLCWMTMYCLIKVPIMQIKKDHHRWCANLTEIAALNLVRNHCPTLFDFPTDFLLYGHVRLLYTNNHTEFSYPQHILPSYICYRQELCEFLSSTINLTMPNNESVTCKHFDELLLRDYRLRWMDIVETVQGIFYVCSSIDNSTHCLEDTESLFHCPNSRKCISKHRLVDGIRDCGGGEDESYSDSCALNDKHRFKCQIDGRCLAPTLVGDQWPDCADNTDEETRSELEYTTPISFHTLCDGFVELKRLTINGSEETDESDCEYWSCNNSYTRCDGFWNCINGADEINCFSTLICSPLEHICISPITFDITCLPIDKANDLVIDCLGGADERQYCRLEGPDEPSYRFLCNDGSYTCIAIESLCDDESDCDFGEDEDEEFCLSGSYGMCDLHSDNNRSLVEELLCQLNEEEKPDTVFFSLKNFANYPLSQLSTKRSSSQHVDYASSLVTQTISHLTPADWPSRWRCNRGLNIRVGKEYICLCPPSYYGDLCEYQNQRVSLTIQVRTEAEWRTLFAFSITLIDDNEHIINSHDQFSYIAVRDCNTKFSMYLLYATRPKDATSNHSIRIDVFDKHSLIHRASWLYPIRFSFLPVNRIAVQLTIPWMMTTSDSCNLNCNHGHCIRTFNEPAFFICQCDHGWSGKQCHIKQKCNCSPQSLCLGSVNNRSICLCPVGMFGPRCFLTKNICQSQSCHNEGQCIPNDYGHRTELEFICICKEGYSGGTCERLDTRIEISFHPNIKIPPSILVHFITINIDEDPTSLTLFKKIDFNQINAVLFTYIQFRLIFTQFDNNYYFAFHQSIQSDLHDISTVIIPSHRCLSVNELFNSTILGFHTLRRLKYYHLPCQEHKDIICFYDSLYMCLCTVDRRADCFEFDHNIIYNCQGRQICANEGRCFQDHPMCPTSSFCVCRDCFYGSRCQYSTKGFDLSLDIILGYHIELNISFLKQPSITKVSVVLAIVIFVIGLISGVFASLTFQAKNAQTVGCGIYLLTASIVSILLVIMLSLKMFLLIVSQMGSITQRALLLGNCVATDFLLRILLSASNWLNACVATERVVAIVKGPYFDLAKSKRMSKYVIILVFLLVIITALHDPWSRRLVDDIEDKTIWCVANYSESFALFNSIVLIFHFLVPFIVNIISAIVIIIMTVRQRSAIQKQLTRREHFRIQFRQHKHLLISPFLLVLLALPRFIMSFLSGCMSSSRNSWFFLAGYFISFIPPISTFFVFVLPSETYKKEFLLSIQRG